MVTTIFKVISFIGLLLLLIVSAQQKVSITLKDSIINKTDERFVSFTIPVNKLESGGVDITNKQLIYLASQYSPSILRSGGTKADYTYYEIGDEDPCHLPSDGKYYCYTMKEFDDLVSFAHSISAHLIFGLAMGFPTYPQDGSTAPWNYSNTQYFLNYIINTKKYTNNDIYGFELGNEVNEGKPYKTPTVQSNAFIKLHEIITSLNGSDFKLFGPDQHSYTLRADDSDFSYIPDFVSSTCKVLSGLTYHSYIDKSSSDILTPNGLNEQYRESSRVSNIFNKNICPSNPDLINNVFAGEIAEHNSGIENVTNTFQDGFWYLDALGTLSNLGQAGFFRQTMATDSYYGLLNLPNYDPNPDYFTGLLFNNLMSHNVLSIKSNENNLRIYAHCAKNKTLQNGVTMAYINLYTQTVHVLYDKDVVGLGDIYLFILTPSQNTLKSNTMSLNGNKLKLDSNGKLPNLNGKKINGGDTITVPKQSYGFFVFTQTTITSCA